MLLAKTKTKKQKKEAFRKIRGVNFVFIGLLMIAASLFFTAFLEKPDPIISPLSKNQTSTVIGIEKSLKSKNIEYKKVELAPDLNYVITLSGNEAVTIASKKDIEHQLSSLQLIISQLKIEGKAFKSLDFRFEKPIISF